MEKVCFISNVMRFFVFGCLLLLLFACSDNTHQCDTKKIVVDDKSSQVSPYIPPIKESIPHKTCTIVSIDHESMCDIYTLDCESETEYTLICHVKPIGTITNPPRPIKYSKPKSK